MSQAWPLRLHSATEAELRQGYNSQHDCLFCDATSESAQAAAAHLKAIHGSPFAALLALPKAYTGLTDRQKTLLTAWKSGTRDADLAKQTGNSASTLRNQRFALRERARQARLLLTILELSGVENSAKTSRRRDGIEQFFKDGRLLRMPARDEKRRLVMERIVTCFEPDRMYTDREVRDLLSPIYEDYAQIRRYLVDHGMLCRNPDGRQYWLPKNSDTTPKEEAAVPLDKRALKNQYKNTVTPMGVYRVLDRETGRFLLYYDRNLHSVQNRFDFLMHTGSVKSAGPFSDPQLFADYTAHPDAFVLEILAEVDLTKYPTYQEAADQLLVLWKEQNALYAEGNRYTTK